MKILVIGASRGTGLHTVRLAVMNGNSVTALARYSTPLKMENGSPLSNVNTKIIHGNVLSLSTFESHLRGMDVVISSIGVSNTKPTTLYSAGIANIIEAMNSYKVRRLICVSGVGVEVTPGMSFALQLATRFIVQPLLKNNFADLLKMEEIVKKSDLDWTIVRAPRLTNKSLTGKYRVASNDYLRNPLTIGREDLAHFIVNNIDNRNFFRSRVEVAY